MNSSKKKNISPLITKWETLVSDSDGLFFEKLVDEGILKFTVSDQDETLFVFEFENSGPYVFIEEEYLLEYWNVKTKDIGWTFFVEKSWLIKRYSKMIKIKDRKFKHYVIATWDCCLEILSENEPTVKTF